MDSDSELQKYNRELKYDLDSCKAKAKELEETQRHSHDDNCQCVKCKPLDRPCDCVECIQHKHIKELEALLKAAQCPCCDGSGAYYDNMGEVCQCQWCDEVSKLFPEQHATKDNDND